MDMGVDRVPVIQEISDEIKSITKLESNPPASIPAKQKVIISAEKAAIS